MEQNTHIHTITLVYSYTCTNIHLKYLYTREISVWKVFVVNTYIVRQEHRTVQRNKPRVPIHSHRQICEDLSSSSQSSSSKSSSSSHRLFHVSAFGCAHPHTHTNTRIHTTNTQFSTIRYNTRQYNITHIHFLRISNRI